MRWTQTLIPTQKETPADAQVVSHQLMVRAGLIRQLTAGAYDFLPLGYRSLRKAAQIVREFLMRGAYSFHATVGSRIEVYVKFYAAYQKIFTRCGIPFVVVEAESGPIGGSASHEFMAACAAGEDTIVTSDKGNYSANVEKAEIGQRPSTFDAAPTGELEKVHTPGMPGIDEVGKFMKVKPKNMLKTLVFKASGREGIEW